MGAIWKIVNKHRRGDPCGRPEALGNRKGYSYKKCYFSDLTCHTEAFMPSVSQFLKTRYARFARYDTLCVKLNFNSEQ